MLQVSRASALPLEPRAWGMARSSTSRFRRRPVMVTYRARGSGQLRLLVTPGPMALASEYVARRPPHPGWALGLHGPGGLASDLEAAVQAPAGSAPAPRPCKPQAKPTGVIRSPMGTDARSAMPSMPHWQRPRHPWPKMPARPESGLKVAIAVGLNAHLHWTFRQWGRDLPMAQQPRQVHGPHRERTRYSSALRAPSSCT